MSFISPMYDWLESLPVQVVSTPQPQALHVLGCQAERDGGVQLLAELPANVSHALQAEIRACGWHGKKDSLHVVADGLRFLLVSTDTHTTSATQVFRHVGLMAARKISKMDTPKLIVCSPPTSGVDVFDGLLMGLYKLKVNTTPQLPNIKELGILDTAANKASIDQRRTLALAITYARTLQDMPPNMLCAPQLANIVQTMSAKQSLTCAVYGQAQLQKLGMGAFLSVAQGEQHEPHMLMLKAEGKQADATATKKVVLVGKGITFDTGGLSLKRRNIEEMKYDMSGAAAVLGAMHYFAQVQPDVTVIGIVGATENAISSQATRPSDIVTAMNGKSIEILDTDAEGRLLLADLLAYAVKNYQPNLLVDIATLTGTVAYALGQVGAGFFSNSDAAAKLLLQASAQAGEPFWQLPIWDEVEDMVASKHADWKNIDETNTESDGMFAASFLHKFVGSTNWLHLDIAGTASDCRAIGFPRKGGSAYGLRTCVELCQMFAQHDF